METDILNKLNEIGFCLDSIFYILMFFLVFLAFKFTIKFLSWLIH